jgi:hypothetical protein
MVDARLEDCAKWLARGLSIAPNGSKWPQHKNETIKWQLGDCAGQLKKMQRGNQRIVLAKRKIMARQSGYCTGQKKNCGTAINGFLRQKEQNSGAAIRVSHLPLQNLRQGNQGIGPASSKFAQGLGIAFNGWHEA